MKRKLLVGAFALFGAVAVNAQQQSVKANPLALLGGVDLVSYERAVSDNSSVGVGLGIGGFKLGGAKYKSAGATAYYRYYFGETALKGWYGHGGLSYQGGRVSNDGSPIFGQDNNLKDDIKYGAFGGNVRAGYQWIWDSGFTLDLNLGLQYTSLSYKAAKNTQLKGGGLFPALGLALGYSF